MTAKEVQLIGLAVNQIQHNKIKLQSLVNDLKESNAITAACYFSFITMLNGIQQEVINLNNYYYDNSPTPAKSVDS